MRKIIDKPRLNLLVCSGHYAKMPQVQRLKTVDIYFLTLLEAGSPMFGYLQGWFLVKPFFLTCRWPFSPCMLTWPFLCACTHPLLIRTSV